MIDRKLKTESCTICIGDRCESCCLNETLSNNFLPNTQTEMLIADGYLDYNDIMVIHQMTMKKRVFGVDKENTNAD